MSAWKPGDVAMVLQSGCERVALRGPEFWTDDCGTEWDDSEVSKYGRDLVVIDPEDDADLDNLCKALVEAMHRAGDVASAANGVHPATVAAALREFANPTPPKPDEPMGLGAVVEAGFGNHFVHTGGGIWTRVGGGGPCEWGHIAVVRVLSEGVTQ